MGADGRSGRLSSGNWLAGGAVVVALLGVCWVAWAGQPRAQQETPPTAAGEAPLFSEAEALAVAERFARAVGLPWGDARKRTRYEAAAPGTPPMWIIRVTSEGVQLAQYGVDAAGGCITYAVNVAHAARHTQKVRLSPEMALAQAAEIMELLGIERHLLAVRRLELTWDSEAAGQHWTVECERVVDGDRVGGSVTAVLNAETGSLVRVHRPPWLLEQIEVGVSRNGAAERALEVGAEVLGTANLELRGPPELRPMALDDSLSPGEANSSRYATTRMAWSSVVSTRRGKNLTSRVWIDAGDGHLLGVDTMDPWGGIAGGGRSARRGSHEESNRQRARVASGYLAAAIAGMAGVIIIVVLLVLWPRRGAVSGSDPR